MSEEIEKLKERVNSLEEAVFGDGGESSENNSKRLSLSEFLQKHDISNHKKKTQVIGYYLEKKKEMENFTSEDIEEAYRRAKIKPPANPSDIISKSAGDGKIMEQEDDSDDLKHWVLTRSGEDRVENELREEQ